MAEPSYLRFPKPSNADLPRHLTHHHGYDYPYAYGTASTVLKDEHQRIHEDPTAFRLDHTHSAEGAPDFEAYSVGFVSASVCTTLSDEETTARLNAEHPTGIESQWQIAEDPTFRNGNPNPCPCEKHPETHRHILFHC